MTVRQPIVNVSGTLSELPAGDNINDPVLAAVAQVSGYTSANILEVEATTLAARVTYRPFDGAEPDEMTFSISHHMVGIPVRLDATTTWADFSNIFTAVWLAGPGFASIRKVNVSAASLVTSGSRAGACRIGLFQLDPLFDIGSATGSLAKVWVPPYSTATASPFWNSLKTRQMTPMLTIQSAGWGGNGSSGAAPAVLQFQAGQAVGTSNSLLGAIVGACPQTAKTNVPNTCIFDHSEYTGMHPLVLTQQRAIQLACSFPVSSGGQQVNFGCQLVWDEWVPTPKVGF